MVVVLVLLILVVVMYLLLTVVQVVVQCIMQALTHQVLVQWDKVYQVVMVTMEEALDHLLQVVVVVLEL
jgi:hypothetical protein